MNLKLKDLAAFGEQFSKRDDGLLHRTVGTELRSLNEATRTLEVIASTESIDSYDEVVLADWDLSRFAKNSPVLYLHNRGGGLLGPTTEETLPIGFATNVRVEGKNLLATLNFVDEKANPLAVKVWEGIRQGSIRAVSVGFRPRSAKEGKQDGKDVVFLSGNELFELSIVPIPANKDAVALSHQRNHELIRALIAKGLEPASSGQETHHMDLEKKIAELESELSASKKAATDHATEIASLRAKISELEGDVVKGAASLKTEKERADKAEDTVIELEVTALVGKKIKPAEKASMIKLRKRDPELFKEQMDLRGDLGITERIVEEETKTDSKVEKGGASKRIAEAANN